MLYFANHKAASLVTAISFFLFFIVPFLAVAQNEDINAVLVLYGNTVLSTGQSAEGVELELKKDGKIVKQILSGKKGRYSLQMAMSITDKHSEYTLTVSQVGTIPKTIIINTYIPSKYFYNYSEASFQFYLPISLIETAEKLNVVQRPEGKIAWDELENKYAFDQQYAILAKKHEEEDAANKKAAEEARLKAAEGARLKAEQDANRAASEAARKKAEEEAERALQQSLADAREKHKQDSLDRLKALADVKAPTEIIRIEKPASPADVDPNAFDGASAYSFNSARTSLKAIQDKTRKEKAANLSTKYETNNTLTSLLNMVDEHDKKMKNQ